MKTFVLAVSALVISFTTAQAATVKPGDVITPDNASAVQDLLSPGNLLLLKQGMKMNIVPSERLEWSPPYKSATEKYSTQVVLNDKVSWQTTSRDCPFRCSIRTIPRWRPRSCGTSASVRNTRTTSLRATSRW